LKILHVIPAYKPAYVYGGPTRSTAELCEALANKGHEVTVYATKANGKTDLEVESGSLVGGKPKLLMPFIFMPGGASS